MVVPSAPVSQMSRSRPCRSALAAVPAVCSRTPRRWPGALPTRRDSPRGKISSKLERAHVPWRLSRTHVRDGMTPSIVIACFAVVWEAVSGGALHNMDPRAFRVIYQATWWLPASLLLSAGAIAVAAGNTLPGTLAGVLSIACAATSFALPFPKAERRKSSEPATRRRVTDSNRRRRVPVLLLSTMLVVIASLLGDSH